MQFETADQVKALHLSKVDAIVLQRKRSHDAKNGRSHVHQVLVEGLGPEVLLVPHAASG
jgi:hypothetical protein